jgi:hypothetical protein
MRFLKMPTYFYTRFIAETNLAVEQLVRVMEKGEEILKLRRRTRIPVAFKNI